MKKSARSRTFVDKELVTMGDVRAALTAVSLDVHSGAITTAESVSLRKKIGERLSKVMQLLKDSNLEELERVMKLNSRPGLKKDKPVPRKVKRLR